MANFSIKIIYKLVFFYVTETHIFLKLSFFFILENHCPFRLKNIHFYIALNISGTNTDITLKLEMHKASSHTSNMSPSMVLFSPNLLLFRLKKFTKKNHIPFDIYATDTFP